MYEDKKEEQEEEHDDNVKEEEKEKEHDHTTHETTDSSFWKKKERIWSYDVFLSYCKGDNFNFTSLLRHSLHDKGCRVYVGVSMIQTEYKTSEIFKAIRESRISIIVFSKRYASSEPCLQQLAHILGCFKQEGRFIYPVFFDVDPSELGSYAETLAQSKKRSINKRQQLEEWRRALSQVADLPDYHHFLPKTMNADECIGAILEQVSGWMNKKEKEEKHDETPDFRLWVKGEQIGRGAHGKVYVARHRETGAICGAIKELDTYKASAHEFIQREIKFLSQLKKHPNIVEYYGHNEDGGPISLYMEYIRIGSLKKYMSDRGGKLHGPLVQNFTAQILFGLVHLHSNRQVHRDLKPANILIDSKNILKLVDFGLAKLIAESAGKHSVGGTPRYASPEVDEKQNYQRLHEALAADIWSLGCVITEMSLGSPPHWSDLDSHPYIPEELCQEGKDFVKRCFKKEPAKRPSAKELLEDPFVKAEALELKSTGLYED